MDMYKNIKHSCTFADRRHLWVRDSLLCVFICSKISINSNGWLGHLIGSVNCDVTGPLWRHQKAVSCLGWDKSISDTRRLSHTPGCTRQDDLTTVRLSYLHNGISYTGKMTSLYWISPLDLTDYVNILSYHADHTAICIRCLQCCDLPISRRPSSPKL